MAVESCHDFLEWAGPDISACVFRRLDDPADLASAAAVSQSWRRFVIENGFSKSLCLRICPEAANFTHVIEVSRLAMTQEVGSSTAVELKNHEKEHRIYTYLSRSVVSTKHYRDCILHCIGASSTDNFPYESIENTLEPNEQVNLRPSYWSSGGESDSGVPESLTYRLNSDLCVIDEIKIQPFRAYFQPGSPIYSSKSVRIWMGHSKLPPGSESYASDEDEGQSIADENYVWTYISPEFPMLQENMLQSFKLPRPALCIGGVVKIELLGRVQRQAADNLYYICVCHVEVIGRSLSPLLIADISDPASCSVLKYIPGARGLSPDGAPRDEARETLQWRAFVARYGHMRHLPMINALLGPAQIAEDDDGSDEEPFV